MMVSKFAHRGFLGKHHTEETKLKLRKSRLGKPSPNKGKKVPKTSQVLKGGTRSTKGKTYKEIYGDRAGQEAKKRGESIKKTKNLPDKAAKQRTHALEQWVRQKSNPEFMKNFISKVGVVNWYQRATNEDKERRDNKISSTETEHWNNLACREQKGSVTRKLWQNPTYVKKVLTGLHCKSSSIELKFLSLTKELFPDITYCGDGNFWITTLGNRHHNPDFRIPHQKKVIEIFGTYWHSKDDEVKYIREYRECSWQCLVIWDYELNDVNLVSNKVREYIK